jgi:predicted nucleotidyltransferase
MIYGSYAREDYTPESDIDLLAVIKEGTSKKIVKGKVNVSQYTKDKFEKILEHGSLFAYHLKTEGKLLIDNDNYLKNSFEKKFKLKNDYTLEKHFAVNLIKDILEEYDKQINVTFAHSKINWSLRTIYSAFGAEKGIPIFSKRMIKKEFGQIALDFTKIRNLRTKNKKHLTEIYSFVCSLIGNGCDIDKPLIYTNDLIYYKNTIFRNIFLDDEINEDLY